MMGFAIRINTSLGVTVQRSHDTDAREYRRAARSATRSSTSIAKEHF
jgi:hypothetical protein